jgi:hypothetical protein
MASTDDGNYHSTLFGILMLLLFFFVFGCNEFEYKPLLHKHALSLIFYGYICQTTPRTALGHNVACYSWRYITSHGECIESKKWNPPLYLPKKGEDDAKYGYNTILTQDKANAQQIQDTRMENLALSNLQPRMAKR